MNTLLKRPDNIRLSASDHLAFHKAAYRICKENEEPIDQPALITGYQSAVAQEEQVYQWIQRNDFTEKKAVADRARYKTYIGMKRLVHIATTHFNPSLRDTAYHLYNLIISYGNLRRLDYNAATAAVESLVARLRSADYLPAVQTLALAGWVDELETQNNLFKSYAEAATEEQLKKPTINMKAARRVTEAALRQITGYVSAKIILDGMAGFTDFVENFNVTVHHYNTLVHEHYGRLHARTGLSGAEIDPIAVQPYTGKPVFVIPVVRLRKVEPDGAETVIELIFSQDFTVSYKNNVEPGTATLVIRGAGQYSGQLTTTFNIVKS